MRRRGIIVPALAAAALGAGVALISPAGAMAASKTCTVKLGDATVLANNGTVRVPLRYSGIARSQRAVTRCAEVSASVKNAYSRWVSQTAANPLPRAFSTGWFYTRWRVVKRNPQWVRFTGRFQAADNPGQARIVYTIKFRGPVTKTCTATLDPRIVANGGRVTARLRYHSISPLQVRVTRCSTAAVSMRQALHHYLSGDPGNPFSTSWFYTRWTQGPNSASGGATIDFSGEFEAADNPGVATLAYQVELLPSAPQPIFPR